MTPRSTFPTMRSKTLTMPIRRTPLDVWEAASDVTVWPRFTDFVLDAKRVASDEYELRTPRGAGRLTTRFNRDLLMLDHVLVVPVRTRLGHTCRVVPNHRGCEVVLTCVKSGRETPADFDRRTEQLGGFLESLRDHLEAQVAA